MAKRGHKPVPLGRGRTSHWTVCNRCGLVLLRNRASQKAWARGCDADNDKEQVEW